MQEKWELKIVNPNSQLPFELITMNIHKEEKLDKITPGFLFKIPVLNQEAEGNKEEYYLFQVIRIIDPQRQKAEVKYLGILEEERFSYPKFGIQETEDDIDNRHSLMFYCFHCQSCFIPQTEKDLSICPFCQKEHELLD